MNAILKYPGAKWKISKWLLQYIPEHKVYCEPFFGSGALFFKKEPSYIETINDLDGNIVNLFKVCREHPKELSELIKYTPFSREEFEDCYDLDIDDSIERARRTLVRYHQSFGTTNSTKKSWRNVQTYGGPRTATMWNYLPDTITECCERLKNAQIECTDGIKLCERYNDPNTFIYCDPPYLQDLRKKNLYAHEMKQEDHERLLEILVNSSSKILLSGYDSELYNDILKGWNSATIKTTVQMGLSRTEKIWFNYDIEKEASLFEKN